MLLTINVSGKDDADEGTPAWTIVDDQISAQLADETIDSEEAAAAAWSLGGERLVSEKIPAKLSGRHRPAGPVVGDPYGKDPLQTLPSYLDRNVPAPPGTRDGLDRIGDQRDHNAVEQEGGNPELGLRGDRP